MNVDVVKNSGTLEPYNPKKLCASLERAGVDSKTAEKICIEIGDNLEPGATTTKIYRESLRRLLKEDIEIAARYRLRRAMDDLGPAGFLFEQFVEALLQVHGYETKRNVMMPGECVSHEVDVYAEKGGVKYLIEAKYRNEHNIKTHVDQVMYADARLMDIQRGQKKKGDKSDYIMWVVTNTRFTQNAINYANCRGMKLVGWNYPKKDNLEEMIVRKKMYPITVLPSVTRQVRDAFAQHNMILAQDILPYSAVELTEKFHLPFKKSTKLVAEAQQLIN